MKTSGRRRKPGYGRSMESMFALLMLAACIAFIWYFVTHLFHDELRGIWIWLHQHWRKLMR